MSDVTKCVIPVSGGIDSTVILHWVASEGKEIHAVSFNYGQRHFDREMECAIANCYFKRYCEFELISQ